MATQQRCSGSSRQVLSWPAIEAAACAVLGPGELLRSPAPPFSSPQHYLLFGFGLLLTDPPERMATQRCSGGWGGTPAVEPGRPA